MISARVRETFSFYWRVVIRPYWPMALLIGTLMWLSACLDMLTIGVTVPLLDALTNPAQARENRPVGWILQQVLPARLLAQDNVLLFSLLAITCGLFFIRSCFFLLHQYTLTATALKFRRSLKASLFERFLRAPYETVTYWARGTVIQRINDPSEAVHTSIGFLGNVFSSLFNCVVLLIFMMSLSRGATLCVGFLVVVGIQGWRILSHRRAEALGRIIFELRGEENKIEVDAVDGIKVVKAHGLESAIVNLQKGFLHSAVKPTYQLELMGQLPAFVNELTASAVVLSLGVMTFLIPNMGLRFSTLVAFLLAIRRIAPAVSLINSAFVSLERLRRTLEVVDEVLFRMPQERHGGQRLGKIEEIALERVSFSYASRPDTTVLHEVAARMRRGQVTAIVGPTGAGKSTIVNLLMGFCVPSTGAIRANGADLQKLDLTLWRRKMGYVSQDVFVFNTTVRENIALWEEVSQEQIEWAARVAQLHDFVVSLPQGYETVVGDRGLRLSGGQCQRLAIARAILKRPDVLVFDEATSALDSLTERAVYDAIGALHRDSVVVVIAHRLTTIKEADRILVLKEGRIVESGTHGELMERRGVYAELYKEGQEETAQGGSPEASPVLEKRGFP